MKSIFKKLKIGDLVIIILLVLISFIPLTLLLIQQSQISGDQRIAIISLENEIIHEINLTEHRGTDIFDIHTHDHETNTIEISDGEIRVKSATCSDQVCVRTDFIHRTGQTVVCLPHQLVIEIQNIGDDSPNEQEVDIIALDQHHER